MFITFSHTQPSLDTTCHTLGPFVFVFCVPFAYARIQMAAIVSYYLII